ncbi:MAG: integrase family protein [Thauera propionica]|jgi:integrase|nr:integrase family protein [Thauera propionica]
MPRQRLTLPRIAAFKPEKESFLWDEDMPRLAVRARPSGSKTFIFKGTLDGKEIKVTIGSTDTWTIDAAREQARLYQRQIDDGKDPRDVIREQREAEEAEKAAAQAAAAAARAEIERAQRYTLRALCDAYTAALERTGKTKSAASTRSAFKCHIDAETASTPAKDVTAHQLAALVRKVREAGKERAAGILRSYLSAAFNAAKRAPFDSALPADLIPFAIEHNPVDAIPAIAVQRGDRTLSPGELRTYLGHILRVGQADSAGPDLADVALLLALLAGGQRIAQLLRAKVSDFDEDAGTLRLWDGKGKRRTAREHVLPLAPRAVELVTSLARRTKALGGEQWLFASWKDTRMADETPGKRAAEICEAMGCESFNLRDIRRTVETMLAALGISKDTRAQLLSHGISGVQAAHYDRHEYLEENRAALVAWENRLMAVIRGEKTPSNVVRLGQRAA